MMSLESIEEMNQEAEKRAVRENTKPYLAKCDGDEGVREAPFIGSYQPKGWKKTNLYFVDNSGLGHSDEPALTFEDFLEYVKEGYGYAIVECGQFQIYIQEYQIEEELKDAEKTSES